MPRPPLRDVRAQRIAILKPSALGDIVHSLPVLSALRAKYPTAHITWVVNRAYEPLLLGHPDLTETLPLDRGAFRNGVRAAVSQSWHLVRELRRRSFDLAIDLQGLLRTGLMALATGARRRVGLESAREGSRFCYTDVVPHSARESRHAVERYWGVAELLGVGHLDKRFHVPIAPDAAAWADERLALVPRPWLLLVPGARWLTKRWPADSFAAVTAVCRRRFGGTAILVGAPDETDIARRVAEQLTGPVLDLCGKTTLAQLAAVLAKADAVLANDTGPAHLAAALGRPVVAPYTCTKARLHGPYGSPHRAIEADVWCQGSYLKRCERLDCMRSLTPELVRPALDEVLASWSDRCRSA